MALPPENTTPANDKAAAKAAAQQDVFLREVDDALRQDQMEGFFKSYGKPLLAVIVLGLAGFGGWLYWTHHQQTQREEHAEAYVQALDSLKAGNLDDAKAKLAPLAEEGAKGSTVPPKLLMADIALKQGDLAGALKLYDAVSADASAPQPYRDLATVRSVAANFDTMKPQDVVARLKPLAAPGNAWFGVAGELVGMAYLKMGKKDQAGPLFAAIAKDEDVSDAVRSRSRQLAAVLGVDAVEDIVDEKGEPFGKADASDKDSAPAAGQATGAAAQ